MAADDLGSLRFQVEGVLSPEVAKIREELDKLKTKSKETKDGFSELKSELGKLVTAGAIVSFLKTSAEKAEEGAIAQAQLAQALGHSSEALNDQAVALRAKVGIDDDEITAMQAVLAGQIKNEAQIKKLTPAVIDLAKATGVDLRTAAMQIARAYADDGAELGRYKIQVDGTAGSQKRLESITEGLTEKFGGQAEAMFNATNKTVTLALALEDFQEGVGGPLNNGLREMSENLADVGADFNSIGKAVGSGFVNAFRMGEMAILGIVGGLAAAQTAIFELLGKLPGKAGENFRMSAEESKRFMVEMRKEIDDVAENIVNSQDEVKTSIVKIGNVEQANATARAKQTEDQKKAAADQAKELVRIARETAGAETETRILGHIKQRDSAAAMVEEYDRAMKQQIESVKSFVGAQTEISDAERNKLTDGLQRVVKFQGATNEQKIKLAREMVKTITGLSDAERDHLVDNFAKTLDKYNELSENKKKSVEAEREANRIVIDAERGYEKQRLEEEYQERIKFAGKNKKLIAQTEAWYKASSDKIDADWSRKVNKELLVAIKTDIDSNSETWEQIQNSLKKTTKDFNLLSSEALSKFTDIGSKLAYLATGSDTAMNDVNELMSGVSNIISGFMSGGVVGGVLSILQEGVNFAFNQAKAQKAQAEATKKATEMALASEKASIAYLKTLGNTEWSSLSRNEMLEMEEESKNNFWEELKKLAPNITRSGSDNVLSLLQQGKAGTEEIGLAVVAAGAKGDPAVNVMNALAGYRGNPLGATFQRLAQSTTEIQSHIADSNVESGTDPSARPTYQGAVTALENIRMENGLSDDWLSVMKAKLASKFFALGEMSQDEKRSIVTYAESLTAGNAALNTLYNMPIEQALLPENLALGKDASAPTISGAPASVTSKRTAPAHDFYVGSTDVNAASTPSIMQEVGSATMAGTMLAQSASVTIAINVDPNLLSSSDNARALGKALGESVVASFRSQGGQF